MDDRCFAGWRFIAGVEGVFLSPYQKDMTGFRFDREDANAR